MGMIRDLRTAAGSVPDVAERLDRAEESARRAAPVIVAVIGLLLVLLAAIAVGVNRGRS